MDLSTSTSIDLTGPEGLALFGTTLGTSDASGFSVVGTSWGFGPARIMELTLSDLHYTPTHPHHQDSVVLQTAADPMNVVTVVFMLAGVLETRTSDGVVHLVAGTAAVLPSNQLPALSCRPGTNVLTVTTPQHLPGDSHRPDPDTITALSATTVQNEPALPFFRALTRTVRTHSITANPTAEIISTLIAALIMADHPPLAARTPRNLHTIQTIVKKNCTDNTFGPRSLARRLGIPYRNLDDIIGTQTLREHITGLINRYRLVHAMTHLHPNPHLSIEEIAYRSGYRSPQQFETAVQETYGINATALLTAQHHPHTQPTPDTGKPQHRLPDNPLNIH